MGVLQKISIYYDPLGSIQEEELTFKKCIFSSCRNHVPIYSTMCKDHDKLLSEIPTSNKKMYKKGECVIAGCTTELKSKIVWIEDNICEKHQKEFFEIAKKRWTPNLDYEYAVFDFCSKCPSCDIFLPTIGVACVRCGKHSINNRYVAYSPEKVILVANFNKKLP